MSELEFVAAQTGPNPEACVIWLHGLGADGHDFAPAVPLLRLAEGPEIRFVFPHAPVRPVTLNGGMQMRAWYDLYSLDRDAPQDEAGIRASAARIETLIGHEMARGFKPEHMILAGFSQGGALALFTALRFPHRLAGIIALSTYLPVAAATLAEASAENRATPIFQAHGAVDDVVPFNFARHSRKQLHEAGYDVEWHEYPIAHSVIPEELQDIRKFLARTLQQ